jgi:uncharacterized protein YicC (UPF0701 family)
MNAEVYDALRAVNVPEDKARVRLSARVDAVKVDLEGRFDRLQTHVDGKFALLQWMIAFNLAMTVALLWKVFAAH